MCPVDDRIVNVAGPVSFSGFPVDPHSTRNLTAAQSGLTKRDLGKLEVAWAIGFPQTPSLGVGAAVMGDTLFIHGAGKLLALDAARGCARWVKDSSSRNTPQIAELEGRKVLVFADLRATVHVRDAATGDELWAANARPANGQGSVRGGVIVYRGKVIVPISASGVGTAMNGTFECCTGHGAVVALALKDGKRLWEYDTMKEAEYTGQTSKTGIKMRGPSGAPVWALPTVDEVRNHVVIVTGENTSFPGTDTSDAIIALDADTGKQAWRFQAMGSDIWNMACNDRDLPNSGPNCPRLYSWGSEGRDFDFGSTPILVRGVRGHDLIVDGQKSGEVWAVDAATGKLIWTRRLSEGTTLGGNHWGVAVTGDRMIVPIADSLFTKEEQSIHSKAGVYALRLTDGSIAWSYAAKPDCAPARAANLVACDTKDGFSAAPLVIDGAVVAGSLDGKLLILDGANGRVLNTLDTSGPIVTRNGIPGKGGTIDSHALSAGDGMVFVTSGYGAFGQTPGNVLIAFKPKP